MLTRRCQIEVNQNMKMHESRDFIVGLIASVEKRKCLWDPSSKYYSRRDKLENAWRDIAKEVGKPEKICREKWKNVRTGFLRSLKEFTPSGVKRRPFYLHKNMKFLLTASTQKESDDSTEMVKPCPDENTMEQSVETYHENSENGEESFGNSVEIMEDNMNSRFSEEMEFFSKHIEQPDSSQKSQVSPLPNQEKVSRKRDRSLDTEATIIKYLKNSSKHLAQTTEESAFRSFLKGIVPDVLSLNPQNQRVFKRKLLELVDDLHKLEERENLSRRRNNFVWTDQHIPIMHSTKINNRNTSSTTVDGDEE